MAAGDGRQGKMSEMRKGIAVFRSLAFRLGIAFLAFSAGILAVSLWHYRSGKSNISRIGQSQPSTREVQSVSKTASTTWIYLANPHLPHPNDNTAATSMIALYANGNWLQTTVLVAKENGKLKLFPLTPFFVSTGRWGQNPNGEITVLIDECRRETYRLLPGNGGGQVDYPVATHWSLMNGVPGQDGSVLRTLHEELGFLSRDRLIVDNIDYLLSLYRMAKYEISGLSRRCLERDIAIFTK